MGGGGEIPVESKQGDKTALKEKKKKKDMKPLDYHVLQSTIILLFLFNQLKFLAILSYPNQANISRHKIQCCAGSYKQH